MCLSYRFLINCSGVADATLIEIHGYRGLKPTAKVSHRYAVKNMGKLHCAASQRLLPWVETHG